MYWLKNSVRNQLLGFGIFCAAAFISLAVLILWQSSAITQRIEGYIKGAQALERHANNSYAQGLQMGQAMRNMVLDPSNRKAFENFEKAAGQFEKDFNQLISLLKTSQEDEVSASKLVSAEANWRPLQRKVLSDIQDGRLEAANATLIRQETPAWRELRALLMEQREIQEKRMTEARDNMESDLDRGRKLVIALAVTGLLGSLGALTLLSRNLLATLGGEPALAADTARRIAQGDLRGRMTIDDAAEDSLMSAMGTMQAQLTRLIERVQDTAHEMLAAVTHVQDTTQHVTSAAEEQSIAAASITSAIEQLSSGISAMADHASNARQLSQRTQGMANESLTIMADASQAIVQAANGINNSSVQMSELASKVLGINGIVQTIREIAEQTNLLALNAAIEAARAGEQGRGFAVVADEVRKLAERTAISTQEISNMIHAVQEGTGVVVGSMSDARELALRGAEFTDKVRTALSELEGSSEQADAAVASIAGALREQQAASSEIARRVDCIARDSEATHRATVDTANQVGTLNNLAHSLSASVERFQCT